MSSLVDSQEPGIRVRPSLRRPRHLDGASIDQRLSGLQRLRPLALMESRKSILYTVWRGRDIDEPIPFGF